MAVSLTDYPLSSFCRCLFGWAAAMDLTTVPNPSAWSRFPAPSPAAESRWIRRLVYAATSVSLGRAACAERRGGGNSLFGSTRGTLVRLVDVDDGAQGGVEALTVWRTGNSAAAPFTAA